MCGVPADIGKARTAAGARPPLRHRRGQGAGYCHSDGVRSPGPGPTRSVAQAREHRAVSAEDSASGLAPATPTDLRATDVCQARAALGRLRQELQGINPSAVASLDEGLEETLTLHAWGEPEDHQLSGIPECAARPAHRPGGSLTHIGAKTALGRQCAEPHRAPPAADQRLPPSPAVARGPAGHDREG